MATENSGRDCLVCMGKILIKKERVFNPMTGPPIIGPGSKHQYNEETSYHCDTCGVTYAFLPKDETRRRPPRRPLR